MEAIAPMNILCGVYQIVSFVIAWTFFRAGDAVWKADTTLLSRTKSRVASKPLSFASAVQYPVLTSSLLQTGDAMVAEIVEVAKGLESQLPEIRVSCLV